MSSSLLRSFAVRSGLILNHPNRILPVPNAIASETPVGFALKFINNTRVVSTANATSSAHAVAVEKYQSDKHQPAVFGRNLNPYVFDYSSVPEHHEDEVQKIEDVSVYLAPRKVEKKLTSREKKMLLYTKVENSLPPELRTELERFKELFLTLAIQGQAPVVMHPDVCRNLLNIMGDVADPNTATLVLNPGPGIITSELVRLGAKNVIALEPNAKFYHYLKDIHRNDAVMIHRRDLVDDVDLFNEAESPLNSILQLKSIKKVKIILCGNYKPVLQRKYLSMLPSISSSPKKVEIYSIVPSHVGSGLAIKNRKRKISCLGSFQKLWNIFIKSEVVGELSAESFFPSYNKTLTNMKEPTAHIIRSTVKRQVCVIRPLKASERPHLMAFASRFKAQSLDPVVGTLEKWSPGVGQRLIMNGINVFTPFRSLTGEQYLNVFFTFLDHTSNGSPVWEILFSRKDDYGMAERNLVELLETTPKTMYIA